MIGGMVSQCAKATIYHTNLGKKHEKSGFFSGRTSKGVGRGNPPTTKQKKTVFFFYKWRKCTGKLHKENIILWSTTF